MKKTWLALVLAMCLILGTAAADTISLSGKVEASDTWQVYAPIGGTAEEVPVTAGQNVTADTVIARVKTTKVYAPQSGTVTAVYGQPGDNAESVTALYGADLYLEGETTYIISATTEKAYDQKENYLVHSGEKVYAVSRSHTTDTGEGIITSVTDKGYTVRVTSGEFYIGDTLDIFRNAKAAASSRIGRGTVERVAPVAVNGTGSIVSCAVKAGDQVEQGQLLFETVTGTFDGTESISTEILAGQDGIISTLSVEKGGKIDENNAIAVIWPRTTMRVVVEVPEMDLKEVQVGQKVIVELDWNQDDGVTYEGIVDMVSSLGTSGTDAVTYKAYISFVPDENTRYGMTALVTTVEEKEETEETEEAEEAEAGDEEADPAAEDEAAGDDEAELPAAESETEGRGGRSGRGGRPSGAEGEGFGPGEKAEDAEGAPADASAGE